MKLFTPSVYLVMIETYPVYGPQTLGLFFVFSAFISALILPSAIPSVN
jgi:hypothetical protein